MRNKFWVIFLWTLSFIDLLAVIAFAEPMSTAMAIMYGSGIAAGGGILGGLLGKKNKEPEWNPQYKELPGYAESDAARKTWSDKLTEWGGEEGYGAIPMNWDEIWNTAKDKVSRYYWGGVNDPGLAGKVKASAARRGVSQSPALENQLTSLGFQESIDLNQLATTEATSKAQYGEQGRQGWLNSMMNLAGLKPSYMTNAGMSPPGTTYGAGNMIGDVSSGIGGLFSQYAQNQMLTKEREANQDWLSKLLGGGMPGQSQSSLTDTSSNFDLGGLSDLFSKSQF